MSRITQNSQPKPGLAIGAAVSMTLALASLPAMGEVPHEFQSGETASAAQVNENFTALVSAIEALQSEVETLQTEKTELEEQVATLEAREIFTHEDFVSDLEEFLAIHYLSPADTAVEGPIIRITGANLQIVNATGEQRTADGTGNLIVGFSEPRDSNQEVCSFGELTTQVNCEDGNGTWAQAHNSGSHNIVGGNTNAYSQTGGLVMGWNNVINGIEATASGGVNNVASGFRGNVSGGLSNEASGNYASITGGRRNHATDNAASVNGGVDGLASAPYASVNGGTNNEASGERGTVSGGRDNVAEGAHSTVSGGNGCTVTGLDGWGAPGLGEC